MTAIYINGGYFISTWKSPDQIEREMTHFKVVGKSGTSIHLEGTK